jgi:hypothetical protein
MTNPKSKQDDQPQFDDVLKRMLSTSPKKHKDERGSPKPASKPAQKKPAK